MKNIIKACLCGCLCLSSVPAQEVPKTNCCEVTCEMASSEEIKKKKKGKKKEKKVNGWLQVISQAIHLL